MADTDRRAAESNKEKEAAAKKTLATQQQARATAQSSPAEGSQPTPTQEENDLAVMGVHTMEKAPDGSPETNAPPDPPPEGGAQSRGPQQGRSMSGGASGGAYDTRSTKPKETA